MLSFTEFKTDLYTAFAANGLASLLTEEAAERFLTLDRVSDLHKRKNESDRDHSPA